MLINEHGALQEHPTIMYGKATPQATAAIRARHPDWAASYKALGRTGLTCSGAGFGSYRVHRSVQSHRAALAEAIRMGINIIDTSSNYAGGNSERMIGEVLAGLIHPLPPPSIGGGILTIPQPPPSKGGEVKNGEGVRREEIIVVSKGGYIQGELYDEMQRRANAAHADYSAGSELSELVRHSEGLWHSIHPDFLRDQITDSLERLQLETIDIYLLHNPEYYIEWALGEGLAPGEVRDEYNRRIKQAFAFLETEVERGRIQYYGISSNTFPKPEDAVDRTSVEIGWQSAEEIAGDAHHFAVIEFPLNIFEPGAVIERNQRHGTETLLEYCAEKNLGVLTNRPLNAIVGKQLIRLADFPEHEIPPDQDLDDLLHDIRLQEEEFSGQQLKALDLDVQSRDAVVQFLTLGRNLDEGNWREFATMEEWQEISQKVLAPRIQYAFNLLRPISQEVPAVLTFLTTYAESVDEAFEHLSNYYLNRGHTRALKIHQALDALIGKGYSELSLSQKAVLLIRSLPQVASVLVGMRSEEYVEDVVYGLQAQPVPGAAEIWERLAAVQQNRTSAEA
ncbi:MAG TPA: aldo/keto reductase [Candidatus Kapabacteria bacterium]|nr:aldo/keto reductase [Candidatus Kapabacteria bacterium]